MPEPVTHPRAVIDLNVRLGRNGTYADLDDVDGAVAAGSTVRIVERESGLHGEATVTRVDLVDGLVYLHVDWSALKAPGPEEVDAMREDRT